MLEGCWVHTRVGHGRVSPSTSTYKVHLRSSNLHLMLSSPPTLPAWSTHSLSHPYGLALRNYSNNAPMSGIDFEQYN